MLYAKMLKEAEKEEIIFFVVLILSLVAFRLEGGPSGAPLATLVIERSCTEESGLKIFEKQ